MNILQLKVTVDRHSKAVKPPPPLPPSPRTLGGENACVHRNILHARRHTIKKEKKRRVNEPRGTLCHPVVKMMY